MEDDYPFLRQVSSPISEAQLRPLDPRCRFVQFDAPLTDADHVALAALLRRYPSVPLRIYGHYSEPPPDLSFLRHYPFLSGFQADVYSLPSIDGIECLPSTLQFFGFGQTKKKFPLEFLARFNSLQKLFLEGHSKGIESIATLSKLEQLTFRSITLPDLSLLAPFRKLWSLDIKLGGTKDLRRLTLATMKGLTELSPVAEAPALDELLVVGANHLTPSAFQPFKNHPTLKSALIGLGSLRKNRAVEELLGIPTAIRLRSEFIYK